MKIVPTVMFIGVSLVLGITGQYDNPILVASGAVLVGVSLLWET